MNTLTDETNLYYLLIFYETNNNVIAIEKDSFNEMLQNEVVLIT